MKEIAGFFLNTILLLKQEMKIDQYKLEILNISFVCLETNVIKIKEVKLNSCGNAFLILATIITRKRIV